MSAPRVNWLDMPAAPGPQVDDRAVTGWCQVDDLGALDAGVRIIAGDLG